MSRTLPKVAALAAVFLAGSAQGFQKAAEKRSTFKDNVYGFSLETPRYPGGGPKVPGMVFMTSGPAVDGFAPNVNVLVQGATTTMKEFTDLSVGQLKQLGLKVNSQKTRKVSGRDALEIDYEGSINGGQNLRFLSLSVLDNDRIIVVTCTTPPGEFAKVEAEYRACVASFRLD